MKTNLDAMFKTERDLEANGIWMEVYEDTAFLVKRMGGQNDAFNKLYNKKIKPYARRIKNDTMDPKLEGKIYIETFVDACLTDWRGVVIDGKDADFDKEVAKKLLLDPSYSSLTSALIAHATDISNYQNIVDEDADEALGNS